MVRIAERYDYMLQEAWGVRAPTRCKITPARIEAAKAHLADWRAQVALFRAAGDTPVRQVTRRMVAKLMARGVAVARVKVPDGPWGSHYIVLADGRHVRIADHYAARENGKPVGGYGSALGRRHHAATRSIVVRRRDGGLEVKADYRNGAAA